MKLDKFLVICSSSKKLHYIKNVRIQSFMEIYAVNLHIQSECGKMRTRKTPNTDTFLVVFVSWFKEVVRKLPSKKCGASYFSY